MARKVFAANIQALVDTLEMLDGEVLKRAVTLLANARRILIIGVGTSTPIVQEMDHRLFLLGLDWCAETDSCLQLMRTTLLESEDVVVAISQSGVSVDPVLTLREAKRRGVKTICITGNEKSPLTEHADVVLVSVSTEASSEAMASRIAQATIVDALYVSLSLLDIDKTLQNEKRIWECDYPQIYLNGEVQESFRYIWQSKAGLNVARSTLTGTLENNNKEMAMAEKDLYESLPFLIADLLILTKMDLLPHLRFDLELCRDYIRRVNPDLRVIETSASIAWWIGWHSLLTISF